MLRSLSRIRIQQSKRQFTTSSRWRSALLPRTIRQILDAAPETASTTEITVNGWIKSVRRQKAVAFAQLSDGTDLNSRGLQIVFGKPEMAEGLDLGTSVSLVGAIVKSPSKGQSYEFAATSVKILGTCIPEEYPIQKKAHTTEYLREHANFRPRTDEIARMLRLRHAAKRAFEDYYEVNGFTSIQAPVITNNDCEGGGEVFRVLPDQNDPGDGESKESSHFFGNPAYLTVSSQLHLEAFASAFSRVYTLQPAFRAERSHTNRHLSEFWMLEAEMAFVNDLSVIMDVVEASIKHVIRDTAFQETLASDSQRAQLDSMASVPWKRITYTEAVEALRQGLGVDAFEWGQNISVEQERWLADNVGGGQPLFVTNYPTNQKPFYMRVNTDESDTTGSTVACFDLLVPRVGELVGGSLREERVDYLEAALNKHGLPADQYEWYTELRRFGTTPHGGFGLGFERFISWVGGWENVRECIPAPRWKGRCVL